MKLEVFKAGKGDSFLLSWEYEGDSNSIIIDAGIKKTYKEIRRRLQEITRLQGIIITHVTYDHLGGFFSLLDDKKPPNNFDLNFNSYKSNLNLNTR
jgi:glyoxylase-like metal-dependent hydrolase (beta-lactamase superfamily II)